MIVLLLVKVIPVFQKMFEDFGGAAGADADGDRDISEFLQAYVGYGMAGVFIFVVAFKQAMSRAARPSSTRSTSFC